MTAFQAEGCGIAYGAAERPGFRRFKGFGLPLAGWFRGWRIALRAMLIKSALRINLSASYVTKSITSISHLRWLPPPLVPYGTTFPLLSGGTIKILKAVLS